MRRLPIPTIVTGAVLVLLLAFYAFLFEVRFSEAAVKVRRFGRESAVTISKPGIYFQWPLLEYVVHYDARLRPLETPETEIKTEDGQNVIVGCYAVWKIEDPLKFYVRLNDEATARERLRTRLNEVRATVIGRHELGEFVNLDRNRVEQTYARLQQEMLDAAGEKMLSDYGVRLVQVGIRRISLPEESTKSVLEAMRQEREKLAARYREEGKGLASGITARANAAKDTILEFASAKAKEIESEGTRATERILSQISEKDAEFFIWMRYLDALREALKTRTTIFLDAQSDLFEQFLKRPAELEALRPGTPALGTEAAKFEPRPPVDVAEEP